MVSSSSSGSLETLLLYAAAATIAASVAVLLRAWLVLVPARLKLSQHAYASRQKEKAKGRNDTVPTMVVLGSGGHTTEMLKLIKRLQRDVYTPITFVVAATDKTSQEKTQLDWKPTARDAFLVIPRSREVGQSWSSSVGTTLKAFRVCLREVYAARPQLVLCNGPGTCIPIVAAVLLLRFCGLERRRSKIVFCESFARVQSLSLSGRLLYYVVDEFVVHWPQLQTKYPRTTHLGVIC